MCMQLKIAVEMAQKPHLKSARTVWILDVDCINVAADFTVSWHCFSPILMGLIRVLAVLTGNPLGFCVRHVSIHSTPTMAVVIHAVWRGFPIQMNGTRNKSI